jgi:protein-S-isoprenylcysteine O-methyltransferase Ste14
MYVGVMMILIAEVIFCNSISLLIYAGLVCLAFNIFIIFWEEPRLKMDFGEQYDRYKNQVRRWI